MPELDGQQLWEADGDSAIDLVSPGFQWGFPGGSDGKESACNTGDPGSVPGLGRSLGAGNGNPLQYFCLENPMDRGDWRATVHGVAESWMWLSIHTHTHTHTHSDTAGNLKPRNSHGPGPVLSPGHQEDAAIKLCYPCSMGQAQTKKPHCSELVIKIYV